VLLSFVELKAAVVIRTLSRRVFPFLAKLPGNILTHA
jgi:hypothetical protein